MINKKSITSVVIDKKSLLSYGSNIDRSTESHKKVSLFFKNLDKIYKKKYNDIDITPFFNIIKNKHNKTKYAYLIKITDNQDMAAIINLYFSLKYTNTQYDIICFVNNEDYYESDYLNNVYIKCKKIFPKNLEIIEKLFDVVISTNLYSFGKLKYNYDFFDIYGYIIYEKILIIDNTCIINKNIDFLFTKYKNSTYANANSHKKYIGGFYQSILLINTSQYYIAKVSYLLKYYDLIFKDLYFCIPKMSNLVYYLIYPNWTNESFDLDIKIHFLKVPYINMGYTFPNNYYIECYYSQNPFTNSIINFFDTFEESKFQGNKSNYENWDKNVKKILNEHPEYKIFFEYIKTYRETLF